MRSLFLAASMFLASGKPTSVTCGHSYVSDSLCVSVKRRGRRMVAVHRAISTDKAAETKQQTNNASGNITPFSNGVENDHPFLLVRQVTDMIIRNWVSSGEDTVMEMIEGSEEPGCPSTYSGEGTTQEMPVKNLKKREQVHAMLLDWDRFA